MPRPVRRRMPSRTQRPSSARSPWGVVQSDAASDFTSAPDAERGGAQKLQRAVATPVLAGVGGRVHGDFGAGDPGGPQDLCLVRRCGIAGDRALDATWVDAGPARRKQIVQQGRCDVPRAGVGQHIGRGDELILGGLQGDGERRAVWIRAGERLDGLDHRPAQRLVDGQVSPKLLLNPGRVLSGRFVR